jgi:hypothetical protein
MGNGNLCIKWVGLWTHIEESGNGSKAALTTGTSWWQLSKLAIKAELVCLLISSSGVG